MVLEYYTRNFTDELENNEQNWQVERPFCCFSQGLLQSENMNLINPRVNKVFLCLKFFKEIEKKAEDMVL